MGSAASAATSFAPLERGPDFEIVAFNDLGDVPTMAHLLEYDSVLGNFDGELEGRAAR